MSALRQKKMEKLEREIEFILKDMDYNSKEEKFISFYTLSEHVGKKKAYLHILEILKKLKNDK